MKISKSLLTLTGMLLMPLASPIFAQNIKAPFKAEISGPDTVNVCVQSGATFGIKVLENEKPYSGKVTLQCEGGAFLSNLREVASLEVKDGVAIVDLLFKQRYTKKLQLNVLNADASVILATKSIELLQDKDINVDKIASDKVDYEKYAVRVTSMSGKELPEIVSWYKLVLYGQNPPETTEFVSSSKGKGAYFYLKPIKGVTGYLQVFTQTKNTNTINIAW